MLSLLPVLLSVWIFPLTALAVQDLEFAIQRRQLPPQHCIHDFPTILDVSEILLEHVDAEIGSRLAQTCRAFRNHRHRHQPTRLHGETLRKWVDALCRVPVECLVADASETGAETCAIRRRVSELRKRIESCLDGEGEGELSGTLSTEDLPPPPRDPIGKLLELADISIQLIAAVEMRYFSREIVQRCQRWIQGRSSLNACFPRLGESLRAYAEQMLAVMRSRLRQSKYRDVCKAQQDGALLECWAERMLQLLFAGLPVDVRVQRMHDLLANVPENLRTHFHLACNLCGTYATWRDEEEPLPEDSTATTDHPLQTASDYCLHILASPRRHSNHLNGGVPAEYFFSSERFRERLRILRAQSVSSWRERCRVAPAPQMMVLCALNTLPLLVFFFVAVRTETFVPLIPVFATFGFMWMFTVPMLAWSTCAWREQTRNWHRMVQNHRATRLFPWPPLELLNDPPPAAAAVPELPHPLPNADYFYNL